MAKLVINLADQFIDTVYFDGSKKIYIGRHPQCDIFLDNLSISTKHAAIYVVDNKYFYIEDLRSTNGTIINDKLISKHILIDGDVIEISKYRMLFWKD